MNSLLPRQFVDSATIFYNTSGHITVSAIKILANFPTVSGAAILHFRGSPLIRLYILATVVGHISDDVLAAPKLLPIPDYRPGKFGHSFFPMTRPILFAISIPNNFCTISGIANFLFQRVTTR